MTDTLTFTKSCAGSYQAVCMGREFLFRRHPGRFDLDAEHDAPPRESEHGVSGRYLRHAGGRQEG